MSITTSTSIHTLAAAQGGVVTAAQAHACGYSVEEIRRLCTCGSWVRLRRGIYRPSPASPDRREQYLVEVAAAVLAVGGGAAVAQSSAAALWGLDSLDEPTYDGVCLAQPAPAKARRYPGLRVISTLLPSSHLQRGPGDLLACTPARTVVDLARHLPLRAGVVVADSALRRGLATKSQLDVTLADCNGWRGARQALRTLSLVDVRAESVAESLARVVFHEAGLPSPMSQVTIKDGEGRIIGVVDFLFPHRVIVEIDGKIKYTNDELWREKRREDRLRQITRSSASSGPTSSVLSTPCATGSSPRSAEHSASSTEPRQTRASPAHAERRPVPGTG